MTPTPKPFDAKAQVRFLEAILAGENTDDTSDTFLALLRGAVKDLKKQLGLPTAQCG